MNIKTVVVTGGAGYVGAVLVPKLLDRGYRVKVIDWYIYGEQVFGTHTTHTHLTQVKGDIRDVHLMKQMLQNADAVIHLACISNDPSFELDPSLGKSINYDATIQLIDISKKLGVKRFIYASSSSVYGIKQESEVTENLSLKPLTGYSKYKALSEEYILTHQSTDFLVTIIRPATVCGYSPRLRLDLIVNLLTIQAVVNKKITIIGRKQLRPNIHIQDMTDAYIHVLESPSQKVAGKIYNVGYENYSLLEIAHKVKKVLKETTINIIIQRTNDLRSYKISSQKIKTELGFVPKYSVETAIHDLQQAYVSGLIPDPLIDDRYYNIRTMKKITISPSTEFTYL